MVGQSGTQQAEGKKSPELQRKTIVRHNFLSLPSSRYELYISCSSFSLLSSINSDNDKNKNKAVSCC